MNVSEVRGLPGRWVYRSRQFFAAMGHVPSEDMAEAREVLGPRLYKVFAALPGQYQLHMLRVCRRVREAGCADREVWQAALLHDSGKYDPATGRYVSLPYRVAFVLLEAAPTGRRLLKRLSSEGSGGGGSRGTARRMGWRYPFYLNRHHARLGALLAARHGASQNVVRLVAQHHYHRPDDQQLAALQAADERS